MKERPIIFSARMVLALLEGTKTQTRRLVKPQPERVDEHMMRLSDGHTSAAVTVPDGWQWRNAYGAGGHFDKALAEHCPYGRVGEQLWVRETFAAERIGRGRGKNAKARVFYRASCPNDECDLFDARDECIKRVKIERWRSPIFMPRAASRITLEITAIRAGRLNDISEDDARAEGVRPFFEVYDRIGQDQRICAGELARDLPYRASYACAWDEINGDRALWSSNPWVWAITFRRVEEPCRR